MNLNNLLADVKIIAQSGDANPDILAPVVEDSRAVKPGGVFVARRGQSSDGHAYIQQAVKQGVVAVVGELPPDVVDCPVPYIQVADAGLALAYLAAAWEGRPARKLTMIGVTGTDGKTTTANLIYSILKAAGVRAGMISTINAVLGDEQLDTGLHVTTPTAPETQSYLARMVAAGLTHCVLETTSHGWGQHRVAACDFDVAAITNITHEHLDFHGSWENYRDAKALLFRDLAQGYRKPNTPKVSVVNLDDAKSADYLLAIPADRQFRYAIHPRPDGDVFAQTVAYGPDATRIECNIAGETLAIESALVGEFNVSNILAAIAVAQGLEIPLAAIKAGVEALKAVSGRMERIDEGQAFLAVVDFAHTPNALKRALEAARLMIPPTGRVIVVFGSAGLRDPEKRAMMGYEAAALADLTVITAEDPRTESLDAIMAVTAEAMRERSKVEGQNFWRVADRGEAIFRAISMARPGDIVLSCGKGHEQSMCFGEIEHSWDDRDAMRAALRGEPLKTLPTATP